MTRTLGAGVAALAAAALTAVSPEVSAPDIPGRAAIVSPTPAEAAAPKPGVLRPAPSGGFSWPLSPVPRVSRAFQPPSRPYGPGHRGADLIGTVGQPVLAAGDGVVVFAGRLADRGVASVDHPDGLRTTYEPVTVIVHPGQPIHRGEPIGTLQPGHPGCPGEACLHWGLRRGHDYLDPLVLVRRAHVRLLPWASGSTA